MDLITKLTNLMSEAGKSDGTIKAYISHLIRLNGGVIFKTFTFLKKTDIIVEKIDGEHACKGKPYSKSSRVGMYCAIIACLETLNMKSYSKCLKFYKDKFNELNNVKEGGAKDEKSDKQKENWVDMEEVMKKHEELEEAVGKIFNKKDLGIKERTLINQYFILSLYTLMPPRRNMDYLEMKIIDNESDMGEDTSKNYIIINEEKMVFNKYKTVRTYGQQTISFKDNEGFRKAFYLYLHTHPELNLKVIIQKPDGNLLLKRKNKTIKETHLLVDKTEKPFMHGNQITRTLNSIFAPKKVGSSLLRSIYITHNFSSVKEELSETADAMAHSVATQQQIYCKTE